MDELMHRDTGIQYVSPIPQLVTPGCMSGCALLGRLLLAAPATFAMYWLVTRRIDNLALQATLWSVGWWVVIAGMTGLTKEFLKFFHGVGEQDEKR